jgi:sulfite reductase (NADPH) hemoprotein beta-component
MYLENASDQEIMQSLDGLIGQWANQRQENESFGDFVIRSKIVSPVIDSAKDFYD